jgi:hypothetical protein
MDGQRNASHLVIVFFFFVVRYLYYAKISLNISMKKNGERTQHLQVEDVCCLYYQMIKWIGVNDLPFSLHMIARGQNN